jgi:hypothetical protein
MCVDIYGIVILYVTLVPSFAYPHCVAFFQQRTMTCQSRYVITSSRSTGTEVEEIFRFTTDLEISRNVSIELR